MGRCSSSRQFTWPRKRTESNEVISAARGSLWLQWRAAEPQRSSNNCYVVSSYICDYCEFTLVLSLCVLVLHFCCDMCIISDWRVDWLTDWLIDWLIHSFIHSFIHSCIHRLIVWFDWLFDLLKERPSTRTCPTMSWGTCSHLSFEERPTGGMPPRKSRHSVGSQTILGAIWT